MTQAACHWVLLLAGCQPRAQTRADLTPLLGVTQRALGQRRLAADVRRFLPFWDLPLGPFPRQAVMCLGVPHACGVPCTML